MNEFYRFKGQELLPEPTRQELLALLTNSKLSNEVKRELELSLNDEWVTRQLKRIFFTDDYIKNLPKSSQREKKNFKSNLKVIDDLWNALLFDFERNKTKK